MQNRPILLRLSNFLRDEATALAHKDGTSLNFFISLAVAEKICRMQNTPDAELVKEGHALLRKANAGR